LALGANLRGFDVRTSQQGCNKSPWFLRSKTSSKTKGKKKKSKFQEGKIHARMRRHFPKLTQELTLPGFSLFPMTQQNCCIAYGLGLGLRKDVHIIGPRYKETV
jgi:hypothetical protein